MATKTSIGIALSFALAIGCGGGDHSDTDMSANTPDGSVADLGPRDMTSPPCVNPTTPQTCTAPVMSASPICNLSQTGCMDPTTITNVNAKATYYEINSPFWSDGAAKNRAFVLPAGGKIHVKDCSPDAGATDLAECMAPNGIANGPADTGRWVFPVGTVVIKNFLFDGKLVETRLLMHVDAATATLIGNGTDWVGYSYAWNEAQTEATVVPDARTNVQFNTGMQTVSWNYPSREDCVGCHNAAIGTIGSETSQMNRVVGSANQIDTFVAAGLFDSTAPTPPYATPTVEPYANATLGLTGPGSASTDTAARSYLASNCGFCHRPDVNDQGFDLRYALSLYETKICGHMQQNGIPGMTGMSYQDLKPGDHANSAMWIRMNIPVPSTDPNEMFSVGRMPPLGIFTVDPQASTLIASWIDALGACPTM